MNYKKMLITWSISLIVFILLGAFVVAPGMEKANIDCGLKQRSITPDQCYWFVLGVLNMIGATFSFYTVGKVTLWISER